MKRCLCCPMGLLSQRGLPGMPGSKSHRRFLLGLCGPFPCSDHEHDSKDVEDDRDLVVDTYEKESSYLAPGWVPSTILHALPRVMLRIIFSCSGLSSSFFLNEDHEVQSVSQPARFKLCPCASAPSPTAGTCDRQEEGRACETVFCLAVFALSELDPLKGSQQKTTSVMLPFKVLGEGQACGSLTVLLPPAVSSLRHAS